MARKKNMGIRHDEVNMLESYINDILLLSYNIGGTYLILTMTVTDN